MEVPSSEYAEYDLCYFARGIIRDREESQIMSNYTDLKVWHKSREVSKQVYVLCQMLPDYERYGLRTQMQRASVSVSSNIVEGSERRHYKEFVHFLEIARASSSELENQLILCRDLGFFTYEQIKPTLELNSEVRQMISGLKRSIITKWANVDK